MRSALSQMNTWPELRDAYQQQIVRPRRELARSIVRRGIAEGVLRDDLDVELLCEIVIGPILLRTVLWDEAPLDDPLLPEQMVDAVLGGVAARPPTAGPAAAGPAPESAPTESAGAAAGPAAELVAESVAGPVPAEPSGRRSR